MAASYRLNKKEEKLVEDAANAAAEEARAKGLPEEEVEEVRARVERKEKTDPGGEVQAPAQAECWRRWP